MILKVKMVRKQNSSRSYSQSEPLPERGPGKIFDYYGVNKREFNS